MNIDEQIQEPETHPEVSSVPVTNQINLSKNEANNIMVLNFDEIIKENNYLKLEVDRMKCKTDELSIENENLKLENNNLKQEMENANKRNMSLQNALVKADENAPEVLFVEKDGGRLYRGGVFLNQTQCLVLDKSKNDRAFLNNLALSVFGREVLKTHSITGLASHRSKGPAKPKVDEKLMELIYDIMNARSREKKTEKLKTTDINSIIGKKMSNMSASESEPSPALPS